MVAENGEDRPGKRVEQLPGPPELPRPGPHREVPGDDGEVGSRRRHIGGDALDGGRVVRSEVQVGEMRDDDRPVHGSTG
ncbi:hypothetical protein Ait01nite_037210 [Actinoplanes italicus]|nr:hypothetical protein Ait01nite_037210 [Actinoplanes italicus]